MSYPDIFYGTLGLLLGAYVLFAAYKLYQEYCYRRKPYVALQELAWQSHKPAEDDELLHQVFLVGDFGYVAPDGDDAMLKALTQHLAIAGRNSTIALLGDNVYPVGLPPEGHRHRQNAEKRLNQQIKLLSDYPGRVLYLSGNHDWNKGRRNGYEQLLRQEQYVTDRLGKVFLPARGCPGPALTEAHPELAILSVNTQWWVQRGERPIGEAYGCKVASEEEFFERLVQLLEQNKHRHVLVVAHHPLYSNALHGGKHTFKHHFFPLTAAHKKLYIPLPVAGSLYPLYRRFFGASEDMSFPQYKRMRKRLLAIFKRYKNVLYAAGHDHNLQHFRRHDNHYIVSGSASKTAYVRKGGKASFTHEHLGFFSVAYYQSGDVWLTALEPDLAAADGTTQVIYQSKLYGA